MQPAEFDALLVRTLEDYRLSRGEKQVLRDVLHGADFDERLLAVFRHRTFDLVREKLPDGEIRKVLDWLEDVTKVLHEGSTRPPASYTAEACFSPGDNCPARIVALLDAALRKIDICVFTITDDRITSAILRAQRRGIDVRIITDAEKVVDLGSDIPQLQDAGIAVRVDRSEHHMHHKFAIFDDARLLTGSYNWTRGAAEHNMENFLVTDDAKLIARYASVFEGIWKTLGRR